MLAIKGLLPKSRFFRGVTVLVTGTLFGQTLVVLASPVLTRLYTPEEFGILAVYASALAILSVVSCLKYEVAIPLPEEDKVAANIIILCLSIVIIGSCILTAFFLTLGDFFVKITNTEKLLPYIWLLPVGFAGIGFYSLLNYWAIRRKKYSVIARTKISQSFGQTFTQIGLGLLKIGPLGLLLGHLIGRASGILSLGYQALVKDSSLIRLFNLSGIRKVAYRYRRFPLIMTPALFLNSAAIYLPSILMATFYGPRIAGFYFLTKKVLTLPVQLVGTSVNQVFVGEAIQYRNENPNEFKRMFQKTTLRLFLLGLPGCLILLFSGTWIFQIVFGENWQTAGLFTQILAPMLLTKFAGDSLTVLPILEKQGLLLIWNIIRLSLVLGGLTIAIFFKLSEVYAVTLLSIALTSSYILKYLFAINSIRKNAENKDSI